MKTILDERGFTSVDFVGCTDSLVTASEGYVYLLCLALGNEEIPFYVGESGRLSGRMGDYGAAQFTAPTDFRVGAAVSYVTNQLEKRVIVRYKRSDDRKRDERLLIEECVLSGYRLLNCLPSYNYQTANLDEERRKSIRFCDMLLRFAEPNTQSRNS